MTISCAQGGVHELTEARRIAKARVVADEWKRAILAKGTLVEVDPKGGAMMAESVQGFGDVYNNAGELVAAKVWYDLTSDPGTGGVGRVTIHELRLPADVAQRYEPTGPNDSPLTLHLQNDSQVDFLIERRHLTGKVDVKAVGGIRGGA